MLAEASDEIVDEEEDGIKLAVVEGNYIDNMGLLTDAPETNEDKDRENSDETHENQQAAVILTLVNILKYTFLQYLTVSENLFLSS